MENTPEKKKTIKWRLNLFDVIFIICAIIVAGLILVFSNRSGGGIIAPAASQEMVVYTMEFQEMLPGTAELIQPGDTLIDKIERRFLGTVVSVELMPSRRSEKNLLTGDRIIVNVPERTDAIVVVTAQAAVTDSHINVGGYIVRAGTRISVNGPLYNGVGFIIDIERGDAK